jgi:7,8-dihydropterin-6-yl-methyl-4-(beta-D-ribofuranosyl)aminobenzene 5'-phosphate synthase
MPLPIDRLLLGMLAFPLLAAAQAPGRVTVLYDAFGERSAPLIKDWGYAALVEYGGKRILFDAGNNAQTFEHNVRASHVDLRTLDFAVISHRHGDHTSGINYLLRVNPKIRIFVPREAYGVFGGALPGTFYRRVDSLPARSRYFDGAPPAVVRHGTPWVGANFIFVDSLVEIAPGVHLVPSVSDVPGTRELRELSLSLHTPAGQVLIVGCSHAGIETIVAAAAELDPRIHLITGGLHLLSAPDSVIERVALALRDRWRVEQIAPGHCTGEPAFVIFHSIFGERFIYAGLGTTIPLSSAPRRSSGRAPDIDERLTSKKAAGP